MLAFSTNKVMEKAMTPTDGVNKHYHEADGIQTDLLDPTHCLGLTRSLV